MAYRIRQIADPDEYADELLDLQRAILPECTPLTPDGPDTWWLVFMDDAPVGFAAIRPSVQTPLAGYLSRAGVLPAHEGNRLQRRLIRAREAFARRQGWQWLVTDCLNENPKSGNNLIACGFRMFWPKKPWASEPVAVYWRKQIGHGVKCEMPR